MKIYEVELSLNMHEFNINLIKAINKTSNYPSIVFVKDKTMTSKPYLMLRVDTDKQYNGLIKQGKSIKTTFDSEIKESLSNINHFICKYEGKHVNILNKIKNAYDEGVNLLNAKKLYEHYIL